MKRVYNAPKVATHPEASTAFPLVAPLAFFSAATASAAAVGAAAGAVATKKLIRANPDEQQQLYLDPICD